MRINMTIDFSGDIWFWRGPAPWYFVTVPEPQCEDLRAVSRTVTYGWGMIPVEVVKARARRSAHTNSHVLHLNDDIWTLPGVIDVTQRIEIVSATFE